MPSTFSRRHAPCSNCGDVVLIATYTAKKMFGRPVDKGPKITLEHADPSPEGEVFDPVDDGCRRQRVAG